MVRRFREAFFDHPQIIQKIHRALHNGNQVYLSVLRRVGKTSIMNFLQDNPEPNQHYVYAITQSIDTIAATLYYLRMGPELKETVEDIIKEVEKMVIDYA